MNKVYIIGVLLLIITAIFAKKEYFTDPTNINNDSIARFLNAIAIIKPVEQTSQNTTAGTAATGNTAAGNKILVDMSDNDLSGNDLSGNDLSGNDWKSQFNGMQFLKDIRSVVRDEIIANNMATANTTKAVIENKVAQEVQTPSIMQGKVFSNPAYDMNQYIRKDSIPCYACSLDY